MTAKRTDRWSSGTSICRHEDVFGPLGSRAARPASKPDLTSEQTHKLDRETHADSLVGRHEDGVADLAFGRFVCEHSTMNGTTSQ